MLPKEATAEYRDWPINDVYDRYLPLWPIFLGSETMSLFRFCKKKLRIELKKNTHYMELNIMVS